MAQAVRASLTAALVGALALLALASFVAASFPLQEAAGAGVAGGPPRPTPTDTPGPSPTPMHVEPTPTPSDTPIPPTDTPTPTPEFLTVIFTNDGSQPNTAYFLLVATTNNPRASVVSQPPGCDPPLRVGGFEFLEMIWTAPCVGPGESITVLVNEDRRLFVLEPAFSKSPPVLSAVNDKGFAADRLDIDLTSGKISGPLAGAVLIQNAPGCPDPLFDEQPSVRLTLLWSSPCVDPGEKVAVHLAHGGGGGYNLVNLVDPAFQFAVSPTPTDTPAPPTDTPPPPVGGIAVDPDRGALVLETPEPSGGNTGLLAGIVAAVATGIVTIGGAAWYARRRWLQGSGLTLPGLSQR